MSIYLKYALNPCSCKPYLFKLSKEKPVKEFQAAAGPGIYRMLQVKTKDGKTIMQGL